MADEDSVGGIFFVVFNNEYSTNEYSITPIYVHATDEHSLPAVNQPLRIADGHAQAAAAAAAARRRRALHPRGIARRLFEAARGREVPGSPCDLDVPALRPGPGCGSAGGPRARPPSPCPGPDRRGPRLLPGPPFPTRNRLFSGAAFSEPPARSPPGPTQRTAASAGRRPPGSYAASGPAGVGLPVGARRHGGGTGDPARPGSAGPVWSAPRPLFGRRRFGARNGRRVFRGPAFSCRRPVRGPAGRPAAPGCSQEEEPGTGRAAGQYRQVRLTFAAEDGHFSTLGAGPCPARLARARQGGVGPGQPPCVTVAGVATPPASESCALFSRRHSSLPRHSFCLSFIRVPHTTAPGP